MQQMTKKERIRAMLRGLPVDRGPVAMWGHDPPREWSPADLVASTLESYREFDWDFIKLNPRGQLLRRGMGGAPTSGRQRSEARSSRRTRSARSMTSGAWKRLMAEPACLGSTWKR